MSLMLVNTPYTFDDWGGKRTSYFDMARRQNRPEDLATLPGEHLGLMSIKAYCASKGIPVHVVNGMLENQTLPSQTFASIEAAAAVHGAPELIGFSGTNFVFRDSLEIIRLCRERWPDVRTCLGYDFATLNFERVLRDFPEVDFICRGEGERMFATLAETVAARRTSYELIPGLAYRAANGAIIANAPRPIASLDDLPWAARDEVKRTLEMGLAVGVFGSRGCPYRCAYCTTGQTAALMGSKGYRERSVIALVDEMEFLVRDHGVHHVSITDDLFVTKGLPSQERAAAFAQELIRRKLPVEFMLDCRVDSISRELFGQLVQAGLSKVFIGIETGSEEQLAFYNKRYMLKEGGPLAQLRILLDLGIKIIPGLIPFHPYVTTKELRATVNLIEAIGYPGTYLVNRVKPYPGTPLYDDYEAKGLLTRGEWPVMDWDFPEDRMYDFTKRLDFLGSNPDCKQDEVLCEFHRQLDAWDAEAASTRAA